MIKNIVLDIGNVLIPFSWRQHLDHFGFSDEIKKRLADAVFLNDDWNERCSDKRRTFGSLH